MSQENIRNFMGYLWYLKEDDTITIGINEEAFQDFDEIESLDLPKEQEEVEEDAICGTIETDQGPLDLYSPVTGAVVEINTAVVDDPSLIQEDPYGEGWLIKIEATEDIDEDDEDEDDEDEEEDEDYEDEE